MISFSVQEWKLQKEKVECKFYSKKNRAEFSLPPLGLGSKPTFHIYMCIYLLFFLLQKKKEYSRVEQRWEDNYHKDTFVILS